MYSYPMKREQYNLVAYFSCMVHLACLTPAFLNFFVCVCFAGW